MKTQTKTPHLSANAWAATLVLSLAGFGCGRDVRQPMKQETASAATATDPLAWVLASQDGQGRTDGEIRCWQAQVRSGTNSEIALERLGALFVAKARESFDPGYYRLAEQCALGLEAHRPGSLEAMLLRGLALQNQHRFKEAEPLARELVHRRGLPLDYGLLGDTLMEQGQLPEATDAYQRMIDLRPDPHSYARGAHIRWLKGDLAGAAELMELAANASSPLDPESAAWAHTRLAFYRFQAGMTKEAWRDCARALEFQKDYPPALLQQGRIRLDEENAAAAVDLLQVAARRIPLPEYQWTLSEALREANRMEEARVVEARLHRTGAANDPRTYALYLATCGNSSTRALRLAQEELQQRADVFTQDALAWSLAAAGDFQAAERWMGRALAEGTMDGRLFFHAAVIAAKAGHRSNAGQWLARARGCVRSLLPSERRQLQAVAADLNQESASATMRPAGATSFSTAAN